MQAGRFFDASNPGAVSLKKRADAHGTGPFYLAVTRRLGYSFTMRCVRTCWLVVTCT